MGEAPARGPERDWQAEYRALTGELLGRIRQYLDGAPREEAQRHLRSILAALDEGRRFAELRQACLEVITALHPRPVRWGYGAAWEKHLRLALEAAPESAACAGYLNDLAEIHFGSGQIRQAVADAGEGLKRAARAEDAARAARILFDCYRASGRANEADALIEQTGARLGFPCPAGEVDGDRARAWMEYNRCRLAQLREQGRVREALALANEMIWLDAQPGGQGHRDGVTALVLAERSTLLWAAARYPEAVKDLQQARRLYQAEGDTYNAELLLSNLGLVYWTMGELDLAERALEQVIAFLKRCGATRLATYDIGNMGLVYLSRGDLGKAGEWLRRHIAHAREVEFQTEAYRGTTNLAAVYFYEGEYQQALELYHSNLDYYAHHGSRDGYGLDQLWIAGCLFRLGRADEALAQARQVLAETIEQGSSVLEAPALRCLASFLPLEQRLPFLRRSLALSRRQGRIFEQAAALLALAQAAETEAEGSAFWGQGVELLKKIGAEAWVKGRSREDAPFLPMFV